jgi:outer membrane immunogenic protein
MVRALTKAGTLAAATFSATVMFGVPSRATDIVSMSYLPYNWSGAYVGANFGAGWETTTPNVSFVSATPFLPSAGATGTETVNGFVGGGQIGANWQISSMVLGVESDFQGTTQRNTIAMGSALATNSMDRFGTVRGRIGLAIERWMPYATVGWGYGDFQSNLNAGPLGDFTTSSAHGFFIVGTGVEVMVWGNASFKIEYLYLDTGSFTNSYAALTPTPLAFLGTSTVGTLNVTTRIRDNVVRAGLNYRFWGF